MVVLFLRFSHNKTRELINFHCYEPISINVDGSALIIGHKIIYKDEHLNRICVGIHQMLLLESMILIPFTNSHNNNLCFIQIGRASCRERVSSPV